MQVESFHLSPIEKELHFNNWRQNNNIKHFLLDLDDTICDTQSIFIKQISEATKCLIKNSPLISENDWRKEIRKNNDNLFEQYGVNPNRWNQLIELLDTKSSLSTSTKINLQEIFANIYTTPLKMKMGTKEGLDFLKKTNTPVMIVTHANRDWTWRKYNWLGLDQYLNWDDIHIVDENGHKTAKSWQEALNYFKLEALNCAVVGDSPRSDINPATSIGIQHCFLIKNSTSWSIHQQEVPTQTNFLNNLGEIANFSYQNLSDFKPRNK